MNKTVTIDFAQAAPADAYTPAAASAHPQSLLDLPASEARESLLAVHSLLGASLPPTPLAIYEAGGGSTSFLPLEVLRRAHVTVVDIDEDQIRNNDYAQETILGDVQTHRFAPGSFDCRSRYSDAVSMPGAICAAPARWASRKNSPSKSRARRCRTTTSSRP